MAELAKINGYDIRDRKLADTGTKTTAVNTDYVLLEDTSGNYQKIAKNSFTEAVRNTLGDILRNNDKGTSINGVPALGSDNDFGSISTANLASVLGVKDGIKIENVGFTGFGTVGDELNLATIFNINPTGFYTRGLLAISGCQNMENKAAFFVSRGYNYIILISTNDSNFIALNSTETIFSLVADNTKLTLKRNIAPQRSPWDESVEIFFIHH